MILNYRPLPKHGESFRGYLIRLVDANGYKSPSWLLSKLDLCINLKTHNWHSKAGLDVMKVIAKEINVSETELRSYFEFDPIQKCLYRGSSVNSLSKKAKVCPDCLKEEKYIRSSWDHVLSSACIKHHKHLLERCQKCDTEISFNRSQISHCSNKECEADFREQIAESANLNSPFYQASGLISYDGYLYSELMLSACARMYRPFDNMPSIPDLESLNDSDLETLYNNAFGLLYSRSFKKQYLEQLTDKRKDYAVFSIEAQTSPLKHFKPEIPLPNQVDGFHIKFQPPSDSFNDALCDINSNKVAGIQSRRLEKLGNGYSHIMLRHQISGKELAKIIDMDFIALRKLIDKKIFSPINRSTSLHNMILDANDVMDKFEKITITDDFETINIKPLRSFQNENFLSRFGSSFADIMEAILLGNINLYRHNDQLTSFIDYGVDELLVMNFLHTAMLSPKKDLSAASVAKILNCESRQIIQLSENKYLTAKHPNKKVEPGYIKISRDSLFEMLDDTISLNRLSHYSGIHLKVSQGIIEDYGIKPKAIIQGETNNNLILYQRDDLINSNSLESLVNASSRNIIYDGERVLLK